MAETIFRKHNLVDQIRVTFSLATNQAIIKSLPLVGTGIACCLEMSYWLRLQINRADKGLKYWLLGDQNPVFMVEFGLFSDRTSFLSIYLDFAAALRKVHGTACKFAGALRKVSGTV